MNLQIFRSSAALKLEPINPAQGGIPEEELEKKSLTLNNSKAFPLGG